MDDSEIQKALRILEEIRDGQKLQLERQAEALALQRQQLEIVQRQVGRAERIQDRAESLQASSARLVSGARKAVVVLLPIILALIGYLTWLLFFRIRR
jgi:hypothetical protein